MRLEIRCQDRRGIALDILHILVAYQIDLQGIEISPNGKIFLNFPSIEFADFQHLMPQIRKIDGIEDVKTTAYMPQESQQNQLLALINSLPDPVFSIDKAGRILLANEAGLSILPISKQQMVGSELSHWLKGFNLSRWFAQKDLAAATEKVTFSQQDYLLDIQPIVISDAEQSSALAGALVILKSAVRLGQQLNVMQKPAETGLANFPAKSHSMQHFFTQLSRLNTLDEPIMLFGEAGVGKRRIARACYRAASSNHGRLLELDGIGLSSEQLVQLMTSDVESSVLDTLIIRNLDALSEAAQSSLLRLLDHFAYAEKRASVAPRCIFTSQRDFADLVDSGAFRTDLYYRLNRNSLVVPPLRQRRDDIPELIEMFIEMRCEKLGCPVPQINKAVLKYAQEHVWPGNVRELENTFNRAVSLLDGEEIMLSHVQMPSKPEPSAFDPDLFEQSLDEAVKSYEKDLLMRLYPHYPSTRQLAKKLKLSHTAIANKLREYGIQKKQMTV